MIRKRAHIPDYLSLILYWPLCTLEHLFLRSQIDVLELCCICNFICLIVGSEAKIGERSYGCLALKGNSGTKTEFGLKEENVTKVTPFVQWTKKSDAKKGELNLLLRHWSSDPPPQMWHRRQGFSGRKERATQIKLQVISTSIFVLSKYRRNHQNLRGNRSLSTKDLSEVRERDLSICCVRIVRAYRREVHFNCGLPRVLAGNEFRLCREFLHWMQNTKCVKIHFSRFRMR